MKVAVAALALALAVSGKAATAQVSHWPYINAGVALMNLQSCHGSAASKAHESLSRRFEAAKGRAVRRGRADLMREGRRRFDLFVRSALFVRCPGGAARSGLRAEEAVGSFERIWPAS